jgi:hypothetical protein
VPEDVTAAVTARLVPVAAPMTGVTNVGVLANTFAPVPVSSVSAAAKFALDGVAKNVATFAAKPDTPVEIGKPVQFVSVPEVGVPRIGVIKVGLVANTNRPVPVSSVIAARKLALVGLVKNAATPAAKTVSALMLYQEFVGW